MTTTENRVLISSRYQRMTIEDDTEESVSGSDYHLVAILSLYYALRLYARRTAQRWYVTAEVLILADLPDRLPARNPWRSMPDVYVVLDADDGPRVSLDIRRTDHFPQFICEVASESTWARDADDKQRVYADLGVHEYIVFDPTARLLGQALRAWHRRPDGSWERWIPDASGFLHSAVLHVALRAEETLLRVYDPVHGRLPTPQEMDDQLQEQAAQLAAQERRTQEQAAQLAALEAQLAQLRDRLPDQGTEG